MSGNPFRRPPPLSEQHSSQDQAAVPFKTVAQGSTLYHECEDTPTNWREATQRQLPKVKHVRIETPPHPSADVPSPTHHSPPTRKNLQDNHGDSPASSSPAEGTPLWALKGPWVDFERRDFDTELHWSDEVAEDTRGRFATTSALATFNGPLQNPLHRPIATIQPTMTGSSDDTIRPSEPSASLPASKGATRSTLDVDSFARLLMTGSAAPSLSDSSSASAVPSGHSASTGSYFPANSSSTDTSSISRHSLFEGAAEPSPRTSYENMPSDDDQVKFVPPSIRTKPPPPRARHGRPVTQRTPQTVSFSDFSPSNPAFPVSKMATGTSSNSAGGITPPELNKALPPLPMMASPRRKDLQAVLSEQTGLSTAGLQPLSNTPQQRSHIEPSQSRRTSYTSISSQLTSAAPGAVEYPPRQSKAPPPPPSRRGTFRKSEGEVPTTDKLSMPVPDTPTPTDSATTSSPLGAHAAHLERPPLPLSSRSSSISGSTRSMPPPAPPPQRRRGSSKGSLELRPAGSPSPSDSRRASAEKGPRTSQEMEKRTLNSDIGRTRTSFDAARRVSSLSLSQVSESEPLEFSGTEKDVLRDMEALQEVEALRERYRAAD